MPTLIIKGKITKVYEHWLSEYDGLEEHRENNYSGSRRYWLGGWISAISRRFRNIPVYQNATGGIRRGAV